ncbi:MAG: streptophobe family protein [Sciscionella sp.]
MPPPSVSEGWNASGGPAMTGALRDWARRNGLRRGQFAGGDWAGAALAALGGIAAMLAVTAVCVLLIGAGNVSAGQAIVLIAMGAALAAGGSLTAQGSGLGGGTSATFTFLPLTITIIGFTFIGAVFVQRLRLHGTPSLVDAVLQAARVWIVLLAGLLVVSLVGRVNTSGSSSGSDIFGSLGVHVTTDVVATMFFGSCWLLFVLAFAVAWRLPAVLPSQLRRWRDATAAPTVGALTIVALSWLIAGVFVIVAVSVSGGDSAMPSGIESGGPSAPMVVGVILLLAPTALLATLGFALGVPSTSNLTLGGSLGTNGSSTLLDATDFDARFWIVPIVAALAVLAGGVVAALHASSPEQARRTGWRLGIALAVLLIAIAMSTAVSAAGGGSELLSGGSVQFHLNYLLSALFGFAWGALGGWLGALLAPRMPTSVITSVRNRVDRAHHREQASAFHQYGQPARSDGAGTGGQF